MTVQVTPKYERLQNAAFWLNHQANLTQFPPGQKPKRGATFSPCPRSTPLIEASKVISGGGELGVMEMTTAEHEAAVLTICSCHAALSERELSHMEFLARPKYGETAGVKWWGHYGDKP